MFRAKNTNAVFSATKQMKRMQGHGCWKASFSVRESAKCNFKSKAQVHERCFFSWNEMLFAMQKTDFHVLELFCRASHVRASMHRITSLELLRTLMLCLVQLSKWRECKAKDAEKLLSQCEKVARAFCRASHVRASMHRITSLELLRTLMLCLVQLSKWRECKATDAEKLLSERKLLNAILRVSSSTWKMFLSHEMKCYLQCRRQIFMFRAFLRAKNTNAS